MALTAAVVAVDAEAKTVKTNADVETAADVAAINLKE